MRITTTCVLGLGLLFSSLPLISQSNDAVEKTLQNTEQSLWQAWKDQNAKAFDPTCPRMPSTLPVDRWTRARRRS